MIHRESQVNIWRDNPIFARIAGALAILALAALLAREPILHGYEDTMFAFAPSAARASLYGERHFSARYSGSYDIARAQYFYEKAAALDPSYPYVNHQLGRIEFLKGNFNTALFYINKEIELHGTSEANTYYVRGLIEGYMGRYDGAVADYEHFLRSDPNDWAAMNDYAWVLLKANRPKEAARIAARGLTLFPDNPWLLNTRAIALYETKEYPAALAFAQKAASSVQSLTQREWLTAYPGNDPKIAVEGIAALKRSIADNMHSIALAIGTSTVQ